MPRDGFGYLDERVLYNLLGKAGLPIDCLYDTYPYELVFYLEGKLDSEREYFEYMNYSLFGSIRQALGKGKKFENPFTKTEKENKSAPTQREQENTMALLGDIFGLDTDEE